MGKFLRLALPVSLRRRLFVSCSIAALFGLAAEQARATDYGWRNVGTDWNTAANWTLPATSFPSTAADSATIFRSSLSHPLPNLSASVTIRWLELFNTSSSPSITLSASGGAALTLTSTADSDTTSLHSAIVGKNGSAINTISAPLVLGAAAGATQTFWQSPGGTTIFTGPISSVNNVNLTLRGGGTHELSGSNSYTGNTLITGTTRVKITNGAAFGTAPSTVTVEPFIFNSVLALANNITVNNKTLVLNDAAGVALTSDGNNTWNGNVSTPGSTFLESTSGTLTITGNVTTNPSAINVGGLSVQGNGNVTITGNITGNGRVQRWTSGTGVVTLTGDNTYGGFTNIFTGTISAASLNSVATPAASSNLGRPTTVANGTIGMGSTQSSSIATLKYTGTGETTDRVINLTSNTISAQIEQAGTGLLKFTSDFTVTQRGNKSLILAGSTTGTGELAGALVNFDSTSTGVIKNGTGTWTLSANNPYSGNTVVNAGTLVAKNTNALGHGGYTFVGVNPGTTTVAAGATLDIAGQSHVNEVLTLNGNGVGGNGALINSSATPMSLGNGLASLNLSSGGSGYSTAPTVTVDAGAATATATLGLTAASFTIDNGGMDYTFAPTVTLSGGGGSGAAVTLTVSGGAITGVNVINPGTGYTSAPMISFSGNGTGAVITTNDTNFQISALRLTGDGSGYTTSPTVSFSGGTTGTAATASANRSAIVLASDAAIGGTGDITINSEISGAFALTKVGSNTLSLNGANTYTGTTTIAAGRLAGSGSLAGSLVNSATLAPGNSIGTLVVIGDATFNAGSSFEAELGAAGSSDLLNLTSVGSNLSLASATDTLNLLSTLDPGIFTIINFNGTRSGIFDAVNFNGSPETLGSTTLGAVNPLGFTGTGDLYTYGTVSVFYNDTDTSVQVGIAAIPEPSTLVLGGLALLGCAGATLRRRRLAKR